MRRRTAGFTFLEMMVAILLFTAVLVTVLPVILRNAQLNGASDTRTQAAVAVQQVLDNYRLYNTTALANLPSSGTQSQTVTAGSETFTVVTTFCAIASLCSGYAHQLTVTAQQGGASILSVETVLTPLTIDK